MQFNETFSAEREKTKFAGQSNSAKFAVNRQHFLNTAIFSPSMKIVTKESQFKVYAQESELEPADAALLLEAAKAVENAYAPYSHFHVGAALRLDDGSIVQGSNQENAAYPSGLCAERVALFRAGAVNNSVKIRAIAVTARTPEMELNKPVSCCGACLQVMADFERRSGNPMRVILRGETGEIYICDGIVNLMPLIFEF